ncbi:nicotinate-nucleotide adenylyltransferase [Desulfurobacterium indicum]|uniref:Probable nicotinate-nucleotide adenylyltransferase n=1 Tax=Desulfurobacterium indicum TaxID=1914305 RepID=A0A1R1MNL5_9BACT|nr:nicotinate-nucleotide adenylyltransferase [Desulfurobacterium indicum]OMH41408.1 nicotinate (nicotinamide) nucleotide adenylyltransferase [Desulfurobacterium indicum]
MKALFGGSFNPVHIGHLVIARDVLESFNFSEIIFVPAKIQPLKGKLLIPPEVRHELLELAIRKTPYFKVWDYEIKKEGISYTVDTLKAFKERERQTPVFIMGADSFLTFPKWKEPVKILETAKIIVVKRPRYNIKAEEILKQLNIRKKIQRGTLREPNDISSADIFILDGRLIEISSTEIRKRLKEGKDIRFLVPELCAEKLQEIRKISDLF